MSVTKNILDVLIFCTYTCVIQFFQSPHATLRKLSLASINQYIVAMPAVSKSTSFFHLKKDVTFMFDSL